MAGQNMRPAQARERRNCVPGAQTAPPYLPLTHLSTGYDNEEDPWSHLAPAMCEGEEEEWAQLRAKMGPNQ